jgi:hypothetical protein
LFSFYRPKCALAYLRATSADSEDSSTLPQQPHQKVIQDVYVLRGGFQEFGAKFNQDKTLVEKYDEEYWKNPW